MCFARGNPRSNQFEKRIALFGHPLGVAHRRVFMATNFLTKIFGSRNDRLLKQYRSSIVKINALEVELEKLTDDDLRELMRSGASDDMIDVMHQFRH